MFLVAVMLPSLHDIIEAIAPFAETNDCCVMLVVGNCSRAVFMDLIYDEDVVALLYCEGQTR